MTSSSAALPSTGPAFAVPQDQDPMQRLLAIMACLRNPNGGCPWDLEQTFATIAPHTIEEAYEVADAIERQDMTALKDELGDLLLQVVFHGQIAKDAGLFDVTDIAAHCADKLIRRHPHVFGDTVVADAEDQTRAWEDIKAAERAAKALTRGASAETTHSVLDDLTSTLPAMTRAVKLQNRVARVGFDWTDARDILGKIEEELEEVRAEFTAPVPQDKRIQDEIGDLLFTVVNLARKAGIDPESALRGTNVKFERRFRRVEALLAEKGYGPADSTLEEMDALWTIAKQEDHANGR